MSNYWELFAETGDIGFYLLYRQTNEENAPPDLIQAVEAHSECSI